MDIRERWIAILLALAGVGLCLTALLTFFSTIVNNGLGWYRGQTAQEHYLAVGRAYSQGFSVGFFLCFFLTLLALGVSSWIRARRNRAATEQLEAAIDSVPLRSSPPRAPEPGA